MTEQTSTSVGTAVPTPQADMSNVNPAQVSDQQETVKEKPAEVKFAEKVLKREFSSVEEAEKSIENLNKLVGDQTTSKQRKALERLASQSGLSTDELIEVIETQNFNPTQPEAQAPVEVVKNLPDDTTKRVVRMETDTFIKDVPEASAVRDTLFAESLQTGKSVSKLWVEKYAPLVEAGKKLGAKKLQSNIEGQPIKAVSTAEVTETKLDFSKPNPATGKDWTSQEMEKYLPHAQI